MKGDAGNQIKLYQHAQALVYQVSHHRTDERQLYTLLQNMLKQDIPFEIIQSIQALFNQWHQQKHGDVLPAPNHQHQELADLHANLHPNEEKKVFLEKTILKAIQQPHHHLPFLELLYTCGKLGLKLPYPNHYANQAQMLNQLYYLMRAHRPLKQHLTSPIKALDNQVQPHHHTTFLKQLTVLTTLYGTLQLVLNIGIYVLTKC